jgi:hypothetical protein
MMDVGLGYLVPVIKDSSEYQGILNRVSEVEETATGATEEAHAATEAVSSLSTIVDGHSTAIGQLTTDVNELKGNN